MQTSERTIERPRVERIAPFDDRRRLVVTPIALVVAVLLGVLAGFLLWGLDDTTSTAAVAVGGEDLTPRQEQMVDLINESEAAWQAGDGEAVANMFTENGILNTGTAEYHGREEIAGYVNSTSYPSLEVLEPVLVSNNGMLTFHRISGVGTLSEVFEFTTDGELLIISHEINR